MAEVHHIGQRHLTLRPFAMAVLLLSLLLSLLQLSTTAQMAAPSERSGRSSGSGSLSRAFTPGEAWRDTNGHLIRAHAGHILLLGGLYHWYGMDTIGCGKEPPCPSGGRPAFHAVNVYVSSDMYNWSPAGVALNSSLYISRPKVVQNRHTGSFVMWCKATPGAAAFVSSTPLGPFRPMFRGTLAGRQVGGLTFYQDVQDVNAAWLVYSAKPAGELPRAMMVLPLSSNW